jgi:hypothetical protein
MRLLAHSARPRQGIPEQDYEKHVGAVENAARTYARHAANWWTGDREWWVEVVGRAARAHDLGKLDALNQRVLATSAKGRLEIPHEDAGVKYLLDRGHGEAAALVRAHHSGLPALVEEFRTRLDYPLRKDPAEEGGATTTHVDRCIEEYAELHHGIFAPIAERETERSDWRASARRWSGPAWRLAIMATRQRTTGTRYLSTHLQTRAQSHGKSAWARWTGT